MKIYHTETQEDYDALMAELEKRSVEWFNGLKMTKKPDNWGIHENYTCVRVDGVTAFYESDYFYEWRYPETKITKYKAKADDKMRFTKENVIDLFDNWFYEQGSSRIDLGEKINALVDEPEKVVVPKCFDEWYQELEAEYSNADFTKRFALWKLCQQGFGHPFERVGGQRISYDSDLGEWLLRNKMQAIDAVLNGYTIEPEQLYYIPLPHLETSDGIQQVLSKRDTYFASRPNEKLKQRFTKEELEQVPEIYKPYAKPIEEEE